MNTPETPEKTSIITDSGMSENESRFGSISIRAIGFLIVVGTVCAMSILKITVEEPLYTTLSMIVGFYFGQKTK